MAKGKTPYNIRRVTFTADMNTRQIKVGFTPKFELRSPEDQDIFINTTLSGIQVAFGILMQEYPVLPEPTAEEVENKVYVFRDVTKDTELFKARKAVYDKLVETFEVILHHAFPDVEYIESSRSQQQEAAFNMTAAELEEHKKLIETIARHVRGESDETNDPTPSKPTDSDPSVS